MLSTLRAHMTYANVMATVALFIALGGSSYAAIKVTSRNVPKNALTGADIKNLTGKDVRKNSLTGAHVKQLKSGDVSDSSLLAKDFRPGEVPAFNAANYYDRAQSDARFQTLPGCPAGTAFHEGACIETSARAADDFRAAEATCDAADNRRLPGPEELLAFRHRPGVELSVDYEWATGLSFDGTDVYANIVNEQDSGSNLLVYTELRTFRCVATPAG